VAWNALYRLKGLDNPVIVSTASPYKFNESVLTALGKSIEGKDEFQLLDELAAINSFGIPAGLAGLKDAEIVHKNIVDKADMPKSVLQFT
jgi:threonine synthase